MLHCEPQDNKILLAAFMVTADGFKTQSSKISATKEPCDITCPGLEICMMNIHGLGWR